MDKSGYHQIIKFTEKISMGKSAKESEFLEIVVLIEKTDKNMTIYKGMLSIFYLYNFNKVLYKEFEKNYSQEVFTRLLSVLDGEVLEPTEIGTLLSNILTTQMEEENRNFLLGCFLAPLWFFMDKTENFDTSVEYGVEIAKVAFSLDDFDFYNKLKIEDKNIKIISMAGSGKKGVKLLNISTMASVITASLSKKNNYNVVLAKTVSGATSSVSGSTDMFEALGVNLNVSVGVMADIMLKTGLGVFNINNLVPKLNKIYDGRLYNVQVFAGLIGGSAIVNSIDVDLINYGLTRGNPSLCLEILSKIYPEKNIIVLQGENLNKESIVDQMSITGDTNICTRMNGENKCTKLSPEDFGFGLMSFEYIKSKDSIVENLKSLIIFLKGFGDEDLEKNVAMEVSLNLYGLGVIDDLKIGASMAIQEIKSGSGLSLIKELILLSDGDIEKFNMLLNP